MVLDTTWGWLTNRPGRALNQFLTDDGDPAGNSDATGDYSTTPQDFWVAPPDGVTYEVLTLNVYLTSLPTPNKDYYGEMNSCLSNGIQFVFKRGESYEHVLNPAGAFKCHQDYILAGARLTNTELDGSAVLYAFRFEFLRDYARPQVLHGTQNESFRVRLNDDFSSLDTQQFTINGIRRALYRDQQL